MLSVHRAGAQFWMFIFKCLKILSILVVGAFNNALCEKMRRPLKNGGVTKM